MPLTIKTKLSDTIKTAMKAKQAREVAVLRLVASEIKRIEVDERIELDDARVLAVLDKMLKQRRESIEHYQKADRQDLLEQEMFEVSLIQQFLPEPLDQAALKALIDEAIEATQATTLRDMGAVMALVRPQVQGRADLAQVSQAIKERLGA